MARWASEMTRCGDELRWAVLIMVPIISRMADAMAITYFSSFTARGILAIDHGHVSINQPGWFQVGMAGTGRRKCNGGIEASSGCRHAQWRWRARHRPGISRRPMKRKVAISTRISQVCQYYPRNDFLEMTFGRELERAAKLWRLDVGTQLHAELMDK